MKKVSVRIDTHYPGVIGKVLLTHAPWAIHAILTVLRPVIPGRLMGKVEIVPSNRVSEKCLEYVESEALPAFWGGSGDNEQFIPGHNLNQFDSTSGEQLVVKAGAQEEQSVDMEEGDIAAFGFHVEGDGQDINFSCLFRGIDGDTEVVRAPTRIAVDSGGSSFTASGKGTLILVFDNSYSWIYAKTIIYELQTSSGVMVKGG